MVKHYLHWSILPLTPEGIVTGLEVINYGVGQGIFCSSARADPVHSLNPTAERPDLCLIWHFSSGFSTYNFVIGYKLTLNFTKKTYQHSSKVWVGFFFFLIDVI